jgi:hypothetical protein
MQNFLDPYLLLVDGSSGGLSDADIVGGATTTVTDDDSWLRPSAGDLQWISHRDCQGMSD